MTGTTIGSVRILGAAFFSTHHASAQDLLAGRERAFTPPSYGLLVGRARRFTSLLTQMHIEVCGALQSIAAEPPIAVFATCHGEIQTAEKLLAEFREGAMVSSARFALSVHNTASGLYSVAIGSHATTTTVTGANAIAAGWLEASLTVLEAQQTVLLSIADEPVPPALQGPTGVGAAAAFLLGFAPGKPSGPLPPDSLRLSIESPDINPLQVLARAVDAVTRDEAATVPLGRIQPGATLELRFPQDARA
ncbi:MAG: beta-ketoacyl synthase chain length factor [Deltaproteobacteria bacterium]|nr:MAG: beta-ketoacyl synthase chain length factor [Deltaproteobacteria bacterium]